MNFNNLLRCLTILLFAFSFFSYFYVSKYAMGICQARIINDRTAAKSLLIASQQSNYKDELTNRLIDGLMEEDIFIELIDIRDLGQVNTSNYDAYVLMHTWEMYKAPSSIISFTERVDSDRVFVVGTSGAGNLSLQGVDGISSASVLHNLNADLARIEDWP